MPTISPAANSKQSLAKGGIVISAAPALYTEYAGNHTDEVEMGRGVSCRRLRNGIEVTPVRTLRTTTTPVFSPTPDRLVFLIKFSNEMDHVFSGKGSLVQFNVGGHLVPLPQGQYADLSNLLLPPRNEKDVQIVGPPLSSIPEGATIGLIVADVATKTDAASNVTERQNFEWFFTFRSDPVTRQAKVQTATRDEATGPAHITTRCG
jgi:hypothetical protein